MLFLQEIQAGVTLKQVTTNTNHDSGITDARDEMMAQIRQGANLKPVSINFSIMKLVFLFKELFEQKN